MAYEVVLRPTQSRAKVRNPWGVLGLGFLTLGFYLPFWWYFINREMVDLGRARNSRALGDSPVVSLLAYTVGALVVIPVIWTTVTTAQRIRRAQRSVARDDLLNGWILALLMIFTLGAGGHVYLQSELNKVWQSDDVEASQTQLGAGPRPAGNAGDKQTDQLDRLEKLARLRDSGALSPDEYEAQKAKMLESL